MKYPPTKEQLHICELATTGKNLLIEAGAGCAKTSTGKYIADVIPNKSILSIFFNKANADEGMQAQDRPTNMFYSTIHSLCYRKVMNEGFKLKLNNFLLYEDLESSLLEKLLLNPEAYASRKEYEGEFNKLKRVTLDCIKLWQQSDATDIFKFVKALPSKQLGYVLKENSSSAIEDLELTILTTEAEEMLRRRCIADTCYKLWVNMIDATHGAKITHDTYVKLFQLFDYRIEEFYSVTDKQYKKVDVLILDERQDSNAVTLSIFRGQTHLQLIACGDSNQNLYSWRGAINDLSMFKGWQQATLSESFRFHQGIADMANYVLSHRDTKLRLIGRGLSKGTGQTAILCRTNAKVLGIVFHALLEEKKVYCVAKLDDMYSMMYHVQAVLNEDKPKFPHTSLKNFDTVEKMEQAIASNQELQSIVKLSQEISKRGGGLHKGIQYLKGNLCKKQEEAELIVSTIHGSKGLGFTNVVIADDFLVEKEDPEEMADSIRKMWLSDSMTALLYVAITRAILSVRLPCYLEKEFNNQLEYSDRG